MTLKIQGLHIIRRLVDVHISRSNGVRASEPPTREVKDVTCIAAPLGLRLYVAILKVISV